MIHAFRDIRLTNSFINATGGVLKVNNETVVYASQTGTLLNYSGILSDRLYQTGVNLLALIGASAAGVTSLAVTGHAAQSGNISFSGLGNVVVHTGLNNFIYFSGTSSDGINLSGSLQTSGQNLYSYITSLSGVGNTTITNLGTTGSNLYNLINNFSGVFNTSGTQYQTLINTVASNLTTTGQNLYNWIGVVSGNDNTTRTNLGTTGSNLYGYITSASGAISSNLTTTGQTLLNLLRTFSGNQQSFSTGITTGFDNYRVDYPLGAFTQVPRIFPSVEISGNTMYMVNITGRSVSSFYAMFSDIVAESGVVLHVYATINQ